MSTFGSPPESKFDFSQLKTHLTVKLDDEQKPDLQETRQKRAALGRDLQDVPSLVDQIKFIVTNEHLAQPFSRKDIRLIC